MSANNVSFNGFDKKGITFLKGIAKNNSKIWFEEHRDDYRAHLLEPMMNFFSALEPMMLKIDPQFMTNPRAGKGITRPHRDTRFSKDKTPYKSSIWLTYRRTGKDWQSSPAYYFEIMRDGYRFGLGFFIAERPAMDALREVIDRDPKRIRAINAIVKKQGYTIEGDSYARPLKDLPEDLAMWYNKKNFYLIKERAHDDTLYSTAILREVSASFKALVPLYELLKEIAAATAAPVAEKIVPVARQKFDF